MSLEKVVYACVDHALKLLLLAYHRVHLGMAHLIHLIHLIHLSHLIHLPYLSILVHLTHLSHLSVVVHVHHGVQLVRRLRLIWHIVDLEDLLIQAFGIVRLGSWSKSSKGVFHKIVIVEELLFLALV